jgi:3-oxoacyl-[acyl-carrier protein] reductase
MRLENKVAIVTGGASGFGEGIVMRFAEEGARLVVADIDDANGVRVAAAVNALHGAGMAFYRRCDVRRDADWRALVDECVQRFGRIDVMVNNAGRSQKQGLLVDIPEEEADDLYALNLKSIYLSARHVVPVMREQGGGAIVNNTSIGGVRPRAGHTLYCGMKGGAIVLSKALSQELAPLRIRVNALCPVVGATPMVLPNLTEEKLARFLATIPLGRLATPRDVANAALYLASDEADFITGVALEVDGGRAV